MKVTCALSESQIERLYAHAYGTMYKFLAASKEDKPSFDTQAYMLDLFDKIAEKEDVATAAKFIQFLPTILIQAKTKLRNLKVDLNALDALSDDFTDPKTGLDNVIKKFRPQESADLKKATIEQREKEAGNIILNDPDGKVYIPEPVLRPFSAFTSTFVQFEAKSPKDKELFTKEVIDESKKRIYATIERIKEENPDFETAYDDVKLNGRIIKLKAQKLTDLDPTQLDSYTQRLISRSQFFQGSGKGEQGIIEADETVVLVITDKDGNELFFDENGELTTRDKGKLVYQFLRGVSKTGSRYSVTNRYGYEQMQTPAMIAKATGMTEEEADAMQQKDFEELYNFKESALKKPVVIDFVGLSKGVSNEISGRKELTFEQLAKTQYGTAKAFSSITLAKESIGGIKEGWGLITVNGQEFPFDRPLMMDDLINKIAEVMTNTKLSVDERANFVNQFLTNDLTNSAKRHELIYDRSKKQFTFKYNLYTLSQRKIDPKYNKAPLSIELYDISKTSKEQLDQYKATIIDVLTRASSNKDSSKFYPVRLNIYETALNNKQFRDYNVETGEFVDEQNYIDLLIKHNPKIIINDDSRPAFSNSYMQFRLPSTYTEEVKEAKEAVEKAETMSAIRKYKNKVVDQILNAPNEVIEAEVSIVNIGDPATATKDFKPARNMMITNLVDGQTARVYFIEDIFDKKELQPKTGDIVYLTVDEDNAVRVANADGVNIGALQETDFAAGETKIEYKPKAETQEQKSEADVKQGITPVDTTAPDDEDLGFFDRSGKLSNNVTPEEIERAEQWVKEHPMFVGKNKISFPQLVNIVNSDSYARFVVAGKNLIDAKILLNANKGGNMVDVYHESWHAFSQLYLTKDQKTKLYNELRDSKPEYKDKSFLELEEILAEDFRSYALKESVKTNRPTRNSLFRRILNWLRNLFARPTTADRMFRDLYFANKNPKLLNKYTPLIDNVMFDLLNRGAEQVGNKKKEALNRKDSDLFTESIDSLISELIDLDYSNKKKKAAIENSADLESKSGVIKIMKDKRNRPILYQHVKTRMEKKLKSYRESLGQITNVPFDSLSTQEELAKNAYAVYTTTTGEKKYVFLTSQVDSFDNLALATKDGTRIKGETYDGVQIVSDFYEHKTIQDTTGKPVEIIISNSPDEVVVQYENFAKVEDTYEDLVQNNLPEITELTDEQQILLNKIRILQSGLNNWGDATEGMVKYHVDNSRYDIIRSKPEEIEDDSDPEAIKESARTGYNKDTGKQSLEEMASKESLYILSSLHKVDKNGNYEQDALGFRKLAPFRSVWNNTARTIGGVKDPQEQFKRLKVAAATFPEFNQLVEFKLPDPLSPKNRNENAITTAFFQDFGRKTLLDILQLTIFDDGVAEVVEAEMDVSSVIRDFRGRFSEDTENDYVTRVNNISVLNLNQIVDAFTDKKNQTFNAKKSLEFARAIGIYLDENKTINNELTANQKAIEYYGLPFIYDIIKKMALQELDRKNITNQVRDFINGFKRDPLKFLMEGIPAGIIGKTETSQKTQVQRLASLQARYGEQYSNFSSVNAERNTIYRFINDHSISLVVDGLNRAEKISDFWTKDNLMYMSYMNPAINPFTNRLRTIKNLFENNAERTKRENKSITLALVSGTQPKDQEGANTTSLDYYSKNLQELHMMLKGGLQEFIRTAAKSSSFGTRIEGGIIDPTGAKKNNARLWIDIDRFANGTADDYAFQYHFLDYIAGEYDRIVTFKNDKELFKTYKGYNRVVGGTEKDPVYAGETFMAFDKVLREQTKKDIFNKVGNQKLDDYLKTDPELRQQIFNDVTDYFKEQTDRNLDTLRKANYISNDLYNQLAVFDLTNDEIEETLVKAYTYNSWIQHFETVILFFGDPAQVNHAKEEQHKRNTGGTSNGAGFRTDKGARVYINEIASLESYAAKLDAENPGQGYNNWNYQGRFNTAIMQDVKRTSIYVKEGIITEALRKDHLQRLSKVTDKDVLLSRFSKKGKAQLKKDATLAETREALAKDLAENEAKSYIDMEEGDGQGYITFDAYKYLKELENDWSDDQDNLYKKIVKGDTVSVEDMLKLFPPYKVQYYGHLHDTKLPVTAMHKFEVTPLIPPMIQGSQLQSLHEQMLRAGIQYSTYQTGSKLGSVTSNGEADVIYEPGSDYKVFKSDIKFTKNIIYLEYLKKVTSMPSEYKEQTVFSTQMRALVLDGLYENGKVIRPEYQELADNYLAAVKNYSEILRYKLEEEIGYKKVDGVPTVNMTKFMKLLQRELRRSDVPEHLINFIGVNPDNTLKFDLSFHPNADMIEKMITTLVEKRLIKQKVKGEGLIQVASSMTNGIWDTSLKRATNKDILKYVGTNNLPFYHPGADGKTTAQKVAIALQGDFVNLLNAEYKGERIATRERLNQAIKDDEWLDANNGRNRKAVTLTGVRIPVDSLSQMDFMEVYEFLDPSASNIIIMASEMVGKSGGDYDGDKLTTSFPHISKKGNFILKKTSNEELSKKISQLKNSKDKNKNAEAKQLIELQEKVLQNELISTVRAILETEGNYANLVRPNTVDRLKDISDELRKNTSEFNILDRAHGEPKGSSMSPTNIFEAGYNLHKHQVNLDSARPLGITAVENKLSAIFNAIGAKMPAKYKFSYYSDNQKKWVQTDKEYKMRLFLPHNTVKVNGVDHISLSNMNSSDNLDVISVLNSQLLNGFLDVEKSDWVAYIQGNLELVPTLIYLLKAGVPVEDAIYFVSNPMVRDYAKQQRLIKSKYNKLIGTRPTQPQFAGYNASVKTLINFGILPNEEEQYMKNKLVTNKTYYQAVSGAVSQPDILKDGVFSREDMLDVIKNPSDNQDKMLAMYLHFLEIEKQIKGVSALKRQLNPDTSRAKTIQEVIRRESAFEDLDANSKIDQETKRAAREDSILSSFFQRDLIIDMIEPVFKFRNNEKVNNFLFDMINLQSGRIAGRYGQGRDGIAKFITDFKNAVASSLYQNNIGPLYDPEGDEIGFESMLGSDPDSFNTKFFDLMKELPESLKLQYSILTQLRPENVKDKRIITLNNRKNVKGDLATIYYQELRALSNPSVSKVSDAVMNQYISQMFELFTLVSVYQNGMGYSDYGFIQAIPFDEIAVIMQKNSKEYLDKLDPIELNRIADILLSKGKFKNYGPAGTQSLEADDITQGPQAPVTLPESEIPDMPEDTRPVTEEDIAQGRTVTKRVLGAQSTGAPVSQTNKPKGKQVKEGIYVNQGALTKEEQLELFDYLKPYLENQAARTLKGSQASKMIGLGLRWDYKSNNPGRQAVDIPDVINPGNRTKYGYYDQSINGQPLGQITPRFRELMQKATGVDMTNYDGAIINLYEKDTFISSHNDVDESRSAIKYPVIGINIGGKGNFSIERLGPENAMLDLQAGTGYVFGVDGINREVWHRTFPTPQDSFLPELTTKIDGKTYPAGSYRITITMRRVMPLTEGMPQAPSIVSETAQPSAPVTEPTGEITGIEINSKETGLGNDLTNVHYAKDGKSKYDIEPSNKTLTLTPQAKNTWGKSVEAWYKSNNARVKGIPEGAEGDAYDMKLMVGLITDKLTQYPDLVSQITERGGLEFLDKSTHTMGTGRWSSKNPKNMFINALKQAYQNVTSTQPTTAPVSTTNNPAEYTNHSGGAIGSDTQWDVIGKEFGMVNNRHYFTGEKGPKNAPLGNVDITDQPIAVEGASKVAQAAKEMWGYKYNTMKDQRLIRNWAQVANSDAVFAIGTLGEEGDIWKGDEKSAEPRRLRKAAVQGGTGYAVEMAIQAGKPVYVFDLNYNVWMKYNPEGIIDSDIPGAKGRFEQIDTPVLTKNFAGIGTREINEAGKQAIRDVYAKTFAGVAQPTVTAEVKPVTEKTITYTPKGKEKQTYTIRGNKIFNKNGEEVFKEASVDKTKIFANLAIKEGRAVVVEHKGAKYVVNNKDQIVSVQTGRLLQWREDNGDRKAVLAMAAAVRDQIATKPQPVSVKLIDDADVQAFNAAVEANKNLKPAEYMIGDSKYILNQNGFYDLVDKNTGDTYVKNVDLTTGYTEMVADKPVNEKQRKEFIKSIKDGIKNFGLEEQLAMENIDVNKILANLEAATTQSEVIESISKILKKIC